MGGCRKGSFGTGKRVCRRREVTIEHGRRERTYRVVYHRARAIGEERRGHLAISPPSSSLALLAYRYFSTRVRLRLTTARGTRVDPFHSFSLVPDEFVVLDKKPPMARTRNTKSARDVSIDSVTADLWHDSPRSTRKAPLHPLESVARRCGILHLRSLPLTRAGTDNVSPPHGLSEPANASRSEIIGQNAMCTKRVRAQTWTYEWLSISMIMIFNLCNNYFF